jgi:hypothetical protein
MNHSAQAEEVDLEYPVYFILFTLFHHAEIADASVVHEHVDLFGRFSRGESS